MRRFLLLLCLVPGLALAQPPSSRPRELSVDANGNITPTAVNGNVLNLPSTVTVGGVAPIVGINSGKTLYVDATNGNNTTGTRGRMDKPYLTLTAAKTAASSGDVIIVGPGTFNEKNLLKNGVNWHFEQGAIIESTAVSTGAVFDDSATGASAAITARITGALQLRAANAVKITNASSNVTIDCDKIQYVAGNTPPAVASVVIQENGYLAINADLIDGSVITALYWKDGPGHIRANRIIANYLTVYVNTDAVSPAGDFFVEANEIFATTSEKAIEHSGAGNPVSWIKAGHIKAVDGAAVESNAGKLYIDALKIENQGGAYAITSSAGILWFNAQKIEGGTDAMLYASGGTVFATAQEWQDDSSTGAGIQVEGGTVNIYQGRMVRTVAGHGVNISGGTVSIDGLLIDTSVNSSSNPVLKSGGTLNLYGTKLVAHSTRDTISAPTAQGVTSYDSTANRAIDSDVTITGNLSIAGAFPSQWLSLSGGAQPYDAELAQVAALADPNADRILFWDDSAGAYVHLQMGTNISISGTTLNVSSGSTGLGAFSEWQAKGDLIVGTADNTAGILTVGANNRMLMADSAETTGLKWATPAVVKAALDLEIGTDVQAYDASLTTLSGYTVSETGGAFLEYATTAEMLDYINAQANIQFQDEGINLGTTGTATSLNFVGTGVTATRATNAITVTIDPSAISVATDSLADAKGDLIGGTADNTFGRLAVGANDTYLVADSSQTTGLKWAALDSDLLSIAALTTTAHGRGLLDDADAAASRTSLGLGGSATLAVGTTAGTVAAGDHTHTSSTLSGIDISDDTNLAGTANEITLTGDTLSIHADITRDTEAAAAYAPIDITIVTDATTARTLALSDKAKLIAMTSSSANTVTVPPNSSVAFPTGSRIYIEQNGTGTSTIAAGVGVTINTATSTAPHDFTARYGVATLIKKATDTWLLTGDVD